MTQTIAQQQIERVFREVYGQAVATLVRAFGDITLAEDAVQGAFVVASDAGEATASRPTRRAGS
jgi:predicted RNA polymerase sigma factor